MKRIKVAHITTIDGSLTYLLLNQLKSIQAEGYQVTGISSPGFEVPVLQGAGIRHISVPMTRSFTPFKDLLSFLRLLRVMKREHFHIVHTHNPKPGLLGQVAARIAEVPVIVNTLHGFYFHNGMNAGWRRFYIKMEKLAARCSDLILSQNIDDMRTAIKEKICEPMKIKYLGNGIDLSIFCPDKLSQAQINSKKKEIGLPDGSRVVGFVGRLVREKGVLEILEAAPAVLKNIPTVRFLFVGYLDREKSDAVSPEIARTYGIEKISHFLGVRRDMPELYSIMDVLVLSSHREGFPRVPMEASAMGVPCISTDIRGCREAVEHRRNGLLIPLGDVEKLGRAIVEVLKDRDNARKMGAEGRKMAAEKFDEKVIFEKVKREYARLLNQKGFSLGNGLSTNAGLEG